MVVSSAQCAAIALTICGVLFAGCASGGLSAAEKAELGDQDPFENVNRATHGFNEMVDHAFLEPTSRAYAEVTPQPAQTCIGNIASNLKEPARAVGHVIAGHGERFVNSGLRFFFNTVLGGLGCLDAAGEGMGLAKNETDIGLGMRSQVQPSQSVYLVVPLLGPSTLVDDTGTAAGTAYLDPLTVTSKRNPYEIMRDGKRGVATGLVVVDTRARLLGTTDLIDEASLDPYVFVREAYLERRKVLSEEIRAAKY